MDGTIEGVYSRQTGRALHAREECGDYTGKRQSLEGAAGAGARDGWRERALTENSVKGIMGQPSEL